MLTQQERNIIERLLEEHSNPVGNRLDGYDRYINVHDVEEILNGFTEPLEEPAQVEVRPEAAAKGCSGGDGQAPS